MSNRSAGLVDESLIPNQTGNLGEREVVTLVSLLSEGEIRLARPRADDHGVDYVAYRDGTPMVVSLQPKVDSRPTPAGALQFSFQLRAMPTDLDSYFGLCLYFPQNRINLDDPFWFIPGKEILEGRPRSGVRMVKTYVPGQAPHKSDRFCHPLAEMARLVGTELDRLAGKGISRGVSASH